MSKEMVNVLKAQVRGLKYANLRGEPITENMNSGYVTYIDLKRNMDPIINGQKITKDVIDTLYLKYNNLILKDENGKKNYRPFLKAVFTEIFEHAGAIVPNDSILEELITSYNQGGYTIFASSYEHKAFGPFNLFVSLSQSYIMDCCDPNCLKFSSSTQSSVYHLYYLSNKVCDLRSSVEFKLKCKDGNVTYEDGKVSLTIPKELKNYKVNGKNLFDIIVEYFQKFCEKLGFKFETKIEHDFGKPLTVTDKPDIFPTKDLKLQVNN